MTAFALGLLLRRKGKAKSLLCLFGGLLGVYALFAARVVCDAMWEAVGHDRTVRGVGDVTRGIQFAGYGLELLGLALIVSAVFTGGSGRHPRRLGPPGEAGWELFRRVSSGTLQPTREE